MNDAVLTIQGRTEPVRLIGEGPWIIGRGDEATIKFPNDLGCSRRQARITRNAAGGFVLENLSANTSIRFGDQVLTAPVALRDGATFSFSNQQLTFAVSGVRRPPVTPGPVRARMAETTILDPAQIAALNIPPRTTGRLSLERSFTVGRLALSDQVVLDHPAVSRRHTAFDVTTDKATVRDLGSTNGTFVNGLRLTRVHTLCPGDRFDIGPFQFTYDGKGLASTSRA